MKKLTFLLAGIGLFWACSSDSDSSNQNPDPEPQPTEAQITTQAPTVTADHNIRLNGTVVSTGDAGYYERGFVWSLNTNPTISDNRITTDGSGTGSYFKDVALDFTLDFNTPYNIRAYVMSNSGSTIYGNNVSYTTPDRYTVTTSIAKEIMSEDAVFHGNVSSNSPLVTSATKGFCYSTSQNPTIASNIVTADNTLGDFQGDVQNLNPNTTYYVRAFAYQTTSHVIYGDQVSFHTTGYLGASGGYVFYDKGETTDGWRYLEAAPADVQYSASLTKWGCTGTNIALTSNAIGSGPENTAKILMSCSAANCAAKICDDYSVAGLSDWFLPSLYEMSAMSASLVNFYPLGTQTNQTFWTSTQYDANNANVVNGYYNFAPGFGVSKNNNNLVRPVRRY